MHFFPQFRTIRNQKLKNISVKLSPYNALLYISSCPGTLTFLLPMMLLPLSSWVLYGCVMMLTCKSSSVKVIRYSSCYVGNTISYLRTVKPGTNLLPKYIEVGIFQSKRSSTNTRYVSVISYRQFI